MELCDVCGQALRGQCTTVNGTVIMHNYLLLLLVNVCRSQASCALLCVQQVWGPNKRQFLWRQTHCKVSVHRLSPGYYSKSRYLSILSASMINVGKQREMFRVSESNCGTLSHSQREQTASRMLQVCLLALALDNINSYLHRCSRCGTGLRGGYMEQAGQPVCGNCFRSL